MSEQIPTPRRDISAGTWTDADAWVLATFLHADTTGPVDLADLIARADAMNHAVLNEDEFEAAAGRLIGAGLLAADGDRFRLTDAGLALCAERRDRGHWSTSVPIGLRKLGPPTGAPVRLPAGAFARAVETYQRRADEAARSSRR